MILSGFLPLSLLLAGCSAFPPSGSEVERNLDKWEAQGITDYRFNLNIGCFCAWSDLMPLTIEVRNSETVSISAHRQQVGRRLLMLIGAAGLALIYMAMGLCYATGVKGLPVLLMVLAGIGCYAMSLAPVVWVVISEVFPNRIRGAAMAVAVSALWVACFILTYTFPILNTKLGSAGTFWLYGAICVAGFTYIKFKLPETKGKSLEQIERELVDRAGLPDARSRRENHCQQREHFAATTPSPNPGAGATRTRPRQRASPLDSCRTRLMSFFPG